MRHAHGHVAAQRVEARLGSCGRRKKGARQREPNHLLCSKATLERAREEYRTTRCVPLTRPSSRIAWRPRSSMTHAAPLTRLPSSKPSWTACSTTRKSQSHRAPLRPLPLHCVKHWPRTSVRWFRKNQRTHQRRRLTRNPPTRTPNGSMRIQRLLRNLRRLVCRPYLRARYRVGPPRVCPGVSHRERVGNPRGPAKSSGTSCAGNKRQSRLKQSRRRPGTPGRRRRHPADRRPMSICQCYRHSRSSFSSRCGAVGGKWCQSRPPCRSRRL